MNPSPSLRVERTSIDEPNQGLEELQQTAELWASWLSQHRRSQIKGNNIGSVVNNNHQAVNTGKIDTPPTVNSSTEPEAKVSPLVPQPVGTALDTSIIPILFPEANPSATIASNPVLQCRDTRAKFPASRKEKFVSWKDRIPAFGPLCSYFSTPKSTRPHLRRALEEIDNCAHYHIAKLGCCPSISQGPRMWGTRPEGRIPIRFILTGVGFTVGPFLSNSGIYKREPPL